MSKNCYAQFSNNFLKLFETGNNFDLILHAGDQKDRKEFKVHTQILCAQSTYFQAALSKKWLKKKGDCYIFEKTNIEADVFEIILRYLYTGEMNIKNCDVPQILKLLVATDELGLVDFLQFARNYLLESKDTFIIEQPGRVLESIFRLESCKKLRLLCINAICNNYASIFDDANRYLTLEKDIFALLLQQDNLCMKEVELWKYVLRWGKSRHPELKPSPTEWSTDDVNLMKKTLAGLIEHVRFFTMSAEEYYDEIRPYKKLFSKELREKMLQFITIPSRKPNDVCTMARPRARLLDSKLVGHSIAAHIAGWIDSRKTAYAKIPYEFTLIYRASRDGFDDIKFRNMCSNQGPTIVIAKLVDHPNIFGGYNPSQWPAYSRPYGLYSVVPEGVCTCICEVDDGSFIFEMSDGKSTKEARIGRLNPERGYHNNRYYHSTGPAFGSNFYILGRAWYSNTSKCNCYAMVCSITSGTLEEYEVFTVKKNN
ncbi:2877_t:CDS:2 [Paraglomus occultum]|uniref:2877_t:CDS:1 n=1 Tax=Paraglomus occultum TaxID=144539 RepID=A0A9N9BS77_9GLOM|nr:2877_t:CDS:2 [Paraglomus occultum]